MQKHKNSLRNIVFLVLSILLLLLQLHAYSQGKEVNIWYFGQRAGIDFNSGSPPVALTNSKMTTISGGGSGTASIADSNGQLLFYSEGISIWNKNHGPMQNGQDMGHNSSQGAMIVPKPGSDHLYYYFNFIWDLNVWQYHFQYSLIDMNLNSGLGGVVDTLKGVLLFTNPTYHLSAVSHANGLDVWVLAHKYDSDYYYAYLVTGDSLHHTPVISQAGSVFDMHTGYMKISPDGKKVASVIDLSGFFNLMDFNNETGMVNDDNMVHNTGISDYYGVEFSPDNSKLYINGLNELFQYDLNAGNPQAILESELVIFQGGWRGALQLAPDGKIYCSMGGSYLSVIHQPNNAGVFCDFEHDAINLEGRLTTGGLPSFIQSYLNDPSFTTQNNCLGGATTFEIAETNGIDSVYWDFNDFANQPNDTSTLLSPAYTFSHADTFEVSLTVYSGLLEKTVTQEVIIHPLPQPQLGNDTLLCDTNFSITLNANCSAIFYSWNTGAFGVPEITVSDTGTYWVRATSAEGCTNYDTINIGLYPQPQLDETNLAVTNAACGQDDGTITGLQVTGTLPLNFFWMDLAGDTIGYTLNLINLPAGSYTLLVADGNGCTNVLSSYTVFDNGSVQMDSIQTTNAHCNLPQGTITVFATPTPNLLFYFINGDSVQNGGLFTGLLPGSYNIMVKDTNGCVGAYANNPVIIDNMGGVQVTDTQTTPEDDYLGNGNINITATVTSGDISYSIYNGNSPQTNNGLFEGLAAGLYNCKVWDGFGCDTTFVVVVSRTTTTVLEAISGFGSSCVGEAAVSPLELNHFNDVYYFEVKIGYHHNVVSCDGYINLNPDLEEGFQASVAPGLGEVYLSWQGQSPLSLPEHTIMAELVFGGLGEGTSPVHWEAGPGESNFFNQNMDTINAVYDVRDVQIYSLPEIQMQPNEDACTGDTVIVDPTVTGGNGTVNYEWSGPNGYESQNHELRFSPVNTSQAGTYTLLVEDTMYCKKSQSIEVNILPSPGIAFSEYDTLWAEPGFILEAGYGAEFYNWNTGEDSEAIVIDSMGNYSVKVTSYEGCKSADAVQILWTGTPFYLPNAFTPNGDGLNDTFGAIPKYDYVNRYHLCIYNRWGQMIFETTDINNGWDGTYQGSPCMPGAYVYRVVYEEFGNRPMGAKVVEGTVMLVR